MKALTSVSGGLPRVVSVRRTGLALACVAALGIAGCGGTDDRGTTTESVVNATPPPSSATPETTPAAGSPSTTTPSQTTPVTKPPSNGGSAGAAAPAGAGKVEIVDFDYAPKDVTIKAGDSVTWTNSDDADHTATQSPGGSGFDTGTLSKGESKTVKFDKPGTFKYICLFHAFMNGTVTVK